MRTREEKNQIILELTEVLKTAQNFYLTDTSGMNAIQTHQLRKICFNKNVQLKVVKNTLLKKALINVGKNIDEFSPLLKGTTALMISESPKIPAQILQDFRKKGDKPTLKGAYVMDMLVVGDQLDFLLKLKTKNELIADVALALQSPMHKLLSAFQNKISNIAGVLKTLAEKKEN
ncbi:MAG: 50S ribosomal protein L10 [Bacteroidales bacterium]|nr:50S ribosomal protein L10 [Bacteroidales bacterium]